MDSDLISIQLELIIEIWNNIFDDIDEKLEKILENSKNEDLSDLFKYLLYLDQKHLVLSIFEDEKYGDDIREKYIVYYYVALILAGKLIDKEQRIPEEVQPLVEEIIEEVKEENKFYSA